MCLNKDLRSLVIAVLFTIVFVIVADAATFTVSKTADTNDGVCNSDCSLREAVATANSVAGNDFISFDPTVFGVSQTITLASGELNISNAGSLSIVGPGQSLLTISGGNASRIIFIQPSGDLTISGVTLINGNGQGQEPVGGGAITAYNSRLFVDGCTLRNNSSANDGGAILGFYGAVVTVGDSTLTQNSARNGGAIMLQTNSSILQIIRSKLSRNSAGSGGAVFSSGGNATVTSSEVSSNTATNGGGGGIYNVASLAVNFSVIADNVAGFAGGIGSDNNLAMTDSVVNGNFGTTEAGGLRTRGTATILRSRIADNGTNGVGGGIASIGTLSTTDSTISYNTANAAGGLYVEHLTMSGSTVNNNSAVDVGGGFFVSRVSTITNSTISGNRAGGDGGGINTVADLSLTSVTVSKNQGAAGGGVFHVQGILTTRNSIFGDNFSNDQDPTDIYGNIVSNGFNLFEVLTNSVVTGDIASNVLGTDPQLLPLELNGGPTKTHALKRTSAAIDVGHSSNNSLDQRGYIRPFDNPMLPNAPTSDGSDIGAFERQAVDVGSRTIFDFDGDGSSDISLFRPSEGNWYLLRGTQGVAVQKWGIASDTIVPADYDGDGKTDLAIFRKAENSSWYILNSATNTVTVTRWGAGNLEQWIIFDTPVTGDFDGDGRSDLAVWRITDSVNEPARFNILQSSTNTGRSQQWGSWGDVPVPADFDGDQRTDVAIARSGVAGGTQWWVNRSSTGTTRVDAFGSNGDMTVAADYSGDGKTDIAVWRPSNGTWYVLRSEDGSYFAVPFGVSTDLASPADYDGDRKADLGIFRPSNGTWYLNRSTNGLAIRPFGMSGDKPIPNAFVR